MSKKQKETFLVNKNDEFIIDIMDLGSDGEGIGKVYPEGEADSRIKINGVRQLLFYCNRDGLFSLRI